MYHIIEISAAEYRGFLTEETAGEYSIYQSPEWYSLVETVFRYRVCYFAIRAVNSFPLAVLAHLNVSLAHFRSVERRCVAHTRNLEAHVFNEI